MNIQPSGIQLHWLIFLVRVDDGFGRTRRHGVEVGIWMRAHCVETRAFDIVCYGLLRFCLEISQMLVVGKSRVIVYMQCPFDRPSISFIG